MRTRLRLGRYIQGHSPVHRLDARAKMISMLLYSIAVFMANSYTDVLIILVFSTILLLMTRIPLLRFIRTIKPLLFILFFIFLFHALTDAGGMRIVAAGPINLSTGGLEKGGLAASRMFLFVTFTSMLTFTTVPERLAEAIGWLFQPLKRIGVPSDKYALMIGIALRFIPTVFDEASALWRAQASRGLDFRERPLRDKARLALALLVPVTAGAFRRAGDLADSMAVRGYRLGEPRTSYHEPIWRGVDTVWVGACLALPAGIAAMEWLL